MKIFITGSSGFVGKHLVKELLQRSIPYIAGTKQMYGDLNSQINWREYLQDCDTVIHLAARVHVMKDLSVNPLELFRKINVEATYKLALAAKAQGIRKFIYISSVKVNGEQSFSKPFSPEDVPHPEDHYGISKMEAEKAIMELNQPGFFDVVIIRPPLIYGPGVKANFEKLFWLVKKDLPIPFGRVHNKRSLVSVLNLVDLIITCCEHKSAAGNIFMVSDIKDYSLKELINEMGGVLNKHPYLLPIPVKLMRLGATMLGKKTYATRLFGNLQVDISKTTKLLNWQPRYSFRETFKFQC
jgi:nucleoside-diphosphate-sugar epimerase